MSLTKLRSVDVYRREIDRARDEYQGGRDWATWCPTCLRAWAGHVEPEGHQKDDVYAPHHVQWMDFTAEPPTDGYCGECAEWRQFPEGQRHFGYSWWLTCGHCDHAHHRDEVWMA